MAEVWTTQLGGPRHGRDKAEAFGRRNAVPGELLVRVTPTHVLPRRNVSD